MFENVWENEKEELQKANFTYNINTYKKYTCNIRTHNNEDNPQSGKKSCEKTNFI